MSARTYALAAAAAVAAGALYVIVHERRRKEKKEALRKLDQPIAKEMLVEILQEASVQATEFAAQIGEWVGKMQQEHNLTEERAHQLRQVCARAPWRPRPHACCSRARAILARAWRSARPALALTLRLGDVFRAPCVPRADSVRSNDSRRPWTR